MLALQGNRKGKVEQSREKGNAVSGLSGQNESGSIHFAYGNRRNCQQQNQGRDMSLGEVALVIHNLGKHLNFFLYKPLLLPGLVKSSNDLNALIQLLNG